MFIFFRMTLCGTEEWMAPEVILGMAYDERADVFSYGLILGEVISRTKLETKLPRNPRDAFSFPFKQFLEIVPHILLT
jgi:serine/threonine protein kinase